MIASVSQVAGKVVEFSAVGKSGIRSPFSCILQGKKPPRKGDEGILEITNAGRAIRFVCNHKFYDFLHPRADGPHKYQGSAAGGLEDVFIHAELGLVRTGRRKMIVRAPHERSMGEIVEKPGSGFEYCYEGEAPFDYEA